MKPRPYTVISVKSKVGTTVISREFNPDTVNGCRLRPAACHSEVASGLVDKAARGSGPSRPARKTGDCRRHCNQHDYDSRRKNNKS